MSITEIEIAEAMRRRPGCDRVEMYAEIQKMRLEAKRADEDRAVMYPHEDTMARVLREASERHTAAGNTRFQATSSEAALARAKCGPGATDTELIASIRERRAWELANPNWINEAAARGPKAAHGRPVERSISEQTRHSLSQSRFVEIRG